MLARPPPLAEVARGLFGMRMFAAAMAGVVAEAFPEAACQRRTVRFCRNVLLKALEPKRRQVAAMLKTVHAMESREVSEAKDGCGGR